MSQTVRHEQCMSSCCYGIIYIAFHQSKIFQSLSQYLADIQMDRLISNSRASQLQSTVVTCQYNAVYVTLAVSKFTAYRYGSGMVGTVVSNAFCTCISQHQTACLKNLAVVMIVKCLSVL